MDRVSPYTQSELEQSGWGFQTEEQPDPAPAAGPTLQLVYDGMQALEMPTFRISGVELTKNHRILFFRKVHTSYVEHLGNRRDRTKRWGWIQPSNLSPYPGYTGGDGQVGYRTLSTVDAQGSYLYNWIRSEFTINENEAGLCTLSHITGKAQVYPIENVLFADLIQPFIRATEGEIERFSGELTMGRGYSHTFNFDPSHTTCNTWRVKNLGFALAEKGSGSSKTILTDVIPFSLSLAIKPSTDDATNILVATLR